MRSTHPNRSSTSRARVSPSSSRRRSETCGISVLDGNEVVYLDHVENTNEVTLRDWTGARLPLHVVSSGLVLLAAEPASAIAAYLAEPLARLTDRTVTQPAKITRRLAAIRRDGYVWTPGEFDEGITSVAAPVVDANGAHGRRDSLPRSELSLSRQRRHLTPSPHRLSTRHDKLERVDKVRPRPQPRGAQA